MRKVRLSVNVAYANGNEYSMEELGLSEDATDEEIEKALYDIVMEHLDWGWNEKES